MAAKLNLYMKSGVLEYWVVDLEKKSIFQYIFSEDRNLDSYNAIGLEETIRAASFDGLELKISDIIP